MAITLRSGTMDRFSAVATSIVTPEEGELLDLLVNLIRDYEATAYPIREKSKPHKTVAFLLEQRGLTP